MSANVVINKLDGHGKFKVQGVFYGFGNTFAVANANVLRLVATTHHCKRKLKVNFTNQSADFNVTLSRSGNPDIVLVQNQTVTLEVCKKKCKTWTITLTET
jgi:hypothetical protein